MREYPNGRIPKLTPRITEILVEGVRAGLPRKACAARASISVAAFFKYLAKGRSGYSQIYVDLLQRVETAESEFIQDRVQLITKAATERDETVVKETFDGQGKTKERVTTTKKVFDWTASAWLLERRFPDDFASNRKDLVEMKKLLAKLLGAGLEAKEGPRDADGEGHPAIGPAPPPPDGTNGDGH